MRLPLASTALACLLLGGCVVSGPYPAAGRVYTYDTYPSTWYGSDVYYYSYEPGPGYYYRPGYGYYRPGPAYAGPRYPHRHGHDHRDRDRHHHRDGHHDHARDEPRPTRPDDSPDRPGKPNGGHRGWAGIAADRVVQQDRPPERPARNQPSRPARAPAAEPPSNPPDRDAPRRRRGWDRYQAN